VNCPKCRALTRIDLQSLIDCEGMRYRRACVSCSWDVWEVQPGTPADLSWASVALALEQAVGAPESMPESMEEGDDEPENDHGQRRGRRVRRHEVGDGRSNGRKPVRRDRATALETEGASAGLDGRRDGELAASLVGAAPPTRG
jgi:hypothetical protein